MTRNINIRIVRSVFHLTCTPFQICPENNAEIAEAQSRRENDFYKGFTLAGESLFKFITPASTRQFKLCVSASLRLRELCVASQ